MQRFVPALLRLPFRYHFFGSLGIVLLVLMVMSTRIADRRSFADGELYQEVAERWGAPIDQPVPSARYVESGSVFNRLEPLPLAHQHVRVDAEMNYRRRGLVFFSGFDFGFKGNYRLHNDRGKTIDLVFVFPLQMIKDQVLLSDLVFTINGQPSDLGMVEDRRQLQWTGRLEDGASVDIDISFHGRGLNSFLYRLDPQLPVRDLRFELVIRGGRDHDYPAGVLPATAERVEHDAKILEWRYAALESGVPVGAILPSEKAYDALILKMLLHAVVGYLIFFAALVAIFERARVKLKAYQGYVLAAGWAFFYVLLPYLAAFANFYLAYLMSLTIVAALVSRFVVQLTRSRNYRLILAALGSSLFVPTLAVLLEGYTGLIYTFEILGLLALSMHLAARRDFNDAVDRLLAKPASITQPEQNHAV